MANFFRIAVWIEEDESWQILETFSSYEEADDRIDYWTESYPHAWVEILDPM